MTGYGRGVAESGDQRVTVELRSVNHRFLDLKVRGAQIDPKLEERVRKQMGTQVKRGSVSVGIRTEGSAPQARFRVDEARAKEALASLEKLRDIIGGDELISVSLLSSQPGVMVVAESEDTESSLQETLIFQALETALEEFVAMREGEGARLSSDLESRIVHLGELGQELAKHANTVPQEAQKRLRARIERLLRGSEVEVDAEKLAHEVAILADRQDITEELVRIASHLEQAAKNLLGPGAIGRKMDFLVQELGREFNTIGSKCQSADMSTLVVESKAELEKIREQIQNIE